MALIASYPPETIEVKLKNFHLGPSAFKVSQDPRMNVFKGDGQGLSGTTMQHDYVKWGSGRADQAIPHAPANMINKDAKFFNTRASETHAEFKGHPDAPPTHSVDRNRLRATNFKMDSDLSKFNEYDPTYKLDYPRREQMTPDERKSLMLSSLPQGDPEKEKQHKTHYMQAFPGYDARSTKPKRAPCLHQDPSVTTRGDMREHHFDTSQKYDFPSYRDAEKVAILPTQYGNAIPTGDREKEYTKTTTMHDGYPQHDDSAMSKGYSRADAVAEIFKTIIKERDGMNADRSTIMKDSYFRQEPKLNKIKPDKWRNHSDVPEGDDEPHRQMDRATKTTSNVYHGHRDHKKPNIVLGGDIFTKSKVSFGDPDLQTAYYDTTQKYFHDNKKANYSYTRSTLNTDSSIPLQYYPGTVKESITHDHYQNPCALPMLVDESAWLNLRKSHIRMPTTDPKMLFSTEHKDSYKQFDVGLHTFDRHHLQRSSVPIGDLNQSLHLDEIPRKGRV